MKRRVLSTIIALLLVAALLPMSVLAAGYTDTDGHWAESSIERWSDAGVVQGTGDAFAPDSDLTCAQLATILAKLLRLPAADDAGFTDNTADAWYYDAINRCAAAGILNGYADGTVRPNETISRVRAMVMLARALGIEPAGTSVLNGYADAANVPDWARGYVAALIRAGIVSGVSGSRLAALADITRAQFVTILDRAIAIYADEDGATVKADNVDGIIVVVAEDVQIKDAPAGTKVVAAASAKGLKVNGKSVDANDIHIVPETVERPKSVGHAHSHEYKYTDNGDGTHTGVCTANDSTLEPAEHEFDENRKCTICGAVQPTAAVASVLGEDGTYTYCNTLAAALAAAADGGTVKLVANVENPGYLTVTNKKVTLDMTGHTITSNDKQVFNVSGSGDLTITGNGTIAGPTGETAKSFDSYSVIYITGENAKLTVLDGTITAGGVGSDGMYGIYVADGGNVILGDADAKTGPSITTWFAAVGENNTTSPANITIYGGEYTAQAVPAANDWWTYFCAPIYASASGDINIYGGTFNGYYGISSRYANVGQNLNISGGIFNGSNAALFVDTKTGTACDETRTIAITGGTFSSDPSGYVAAGHLAIAQEDGLYRVVEGTGKVEVSLSELGSISLPQGPKEDGEASTTFTVDLDGATVEPTTINYSEHATGHTGPGVMIGSTDMNHYAAKPAGAGDYQYVIQGGTINGEVTGYSSIDGATTNSVYMLVPGNSDVTFEDVTFNGVVSFDIQKYTSPWSHLNAITFKNCTFNGIIVGTCPASNVTFDGCTFNDYTNSIYANNSNPIWWRADYEGEGGNATYIENFTFVNNRVTSTRPVKIERIGRDACNPVFTFQNNYFDISAQEGDTVTKNMAINIGQWDAFSKFTLIDEGNTISANTAALYTAALGSGSNQYVAVSGSKVLDGSGNEKVITAMVWKTTTGETFEIKSID